MKSIFLDNVAAVVAIPAQLVQAALWPRLLNHHTHGIRKSNRVVRGVCRQQKELPFIDVDIHELIFPIDLLNRLEQHPAFVLVEELRRLVDVVVCAGIGSAHDHDSHRIAVDAVVVDWRLEQVGVFAEPFGQVQWEACRRSGGGRRESLPLEREW